MDALLKRTTKEDQRIALNAISFLESTTEEIKGRKEKGVKIKIQETGAFISIPKKALSLLFSIVANMAEGKSITLIPSDSELTTSQAADMLNVSRPHVVKLLEQGEIPFKKVGKHRRIALQDVIKYEASLKSERTKNLDFLANQAQDLNLGY